MGPNDRFEEKTKGDASRMRQEIGTKGKKGVVQIYGSNSTDFPLGIRIRLIAEYRDVKGNIHNIKKLANLRGKQTHFCQKLGNELSEDILNLDVMHSKLK